MFSLIGPWRRHLPARLNQRCSSSFLGLAVLAIFCLAWPTLAMAETDEDSAEYQAMLDLSDEAAAAINDGDYPYAAVRFRQAYATYPDPILLKNETISWFHGDDCRSALAPGEAYLETGEFSTEDRQDVEAVLIECRLRLAESAVDEDDTALAAYHLDNLPDVERTDAEEERFQQIQEHFPASDVTPAPGPTAAPGTHLGWAQIAGGVALLGAGLSMHTVALDRQSLLQELADSTDPADTRLLERHVDEWGSYQRTTRWLVPTLYVVGAAALGSGTFFLLRRPGGDDNGATTAIQPTLSPTQMGMTFQHHF